MMLALLAGIFSMARAVVLQTKPFERTVLPTSNVQYGMGMVNCPHGVTRDPVGQCKEKSLLLDIYFPTTFGTGPDVLVLKPAILLAHGGANIHGSKRDPEMVASAKFWASNGFVAFVTDFRLLDDQGTYPGEDFKFQSDRWSRMYPAVRDVKAALRFIRAKAATYGVDPDRIIASGDSAGSMNILAAAVSGYTGFTTELSQAEDPTLVLVHPRVRATVQAVILHWGNSWALQALAQHRALQAHSSGMDAKAQPKVNFNNVPISDADFLSRRLPALIQFHGDKDMTVSYEFATDLDRMYDSMGAVHHLETLNGSDHWNWSYGCGHSDPGMYCPNMDRVALKLISKIGLPSAARTKRCNATSLMYRPPGPTTGEGAMGL